VSEQNMCEALEGDGEAGRSQDPNHPPRGTAGEYSCVVECFSAGRVPVQ
jgi:hypothetical protein